MSKNHHTQSMEKIMDINYSLVMFRFRKLNDSIYVCINRHMKAVNIIQLYNLAKLRKRKNKYTI